MKRGLKAPARGSKARAHRHETPVLGDLSVAEFLREYWQRRPCLIRQAVPDTPALLSKAELLALAGSEAVESRLIESSAGQWRLEHGPLRPSQLPGRRRTWTVLVQGVDLHHEPIHQLLRRFRFVPDARLDDIMVSYATAGGGVGPHVDSYDVFLLQAWGQRCWRIGPPGDSTLVPDRPVKLLANFQPTESWRLEPGDMLYLPPGWQHEGTALDECMTISVGFRAPSRQEFLSAFLAAASDEPGGPDLRFSDPGRAGTRHPGQMPQDLLETAQRWVQSWRPTRGDIDRFTGCYLTEPKPTVWFESPPAASAAKLRRLFEREGIRLDRKSRMAWHANQIFLNGEAYVPERAIRRALRSLADQRVLSASECRELLAQPEGRTLLTRWFESGWIQAGTAEVQPSPSS